MFIHFSGVEYIAVDNLKETCEDFVLMGIRYEHLYPPTPDLDYIPLHVQITDRYTNKWFFQIEIFFRDIGTLS